MNRPAAVALCLVSALAALAGVMSRGSESSLISPQQHRPRPHIRRVPPPIDLRGLWDASTIVARVRVESEEPRTEQAPASKYPNEWTVYTVKALQILKGKDLVKDQEAILRILRYGQKRGNPIEDRVLDDGFAPFGLGMQYVLFLERGTGEHASFYYVAYWGAGAYWIRNEQIDAMSDDAVALHQQGRQLAALLKELQELADKGRQQP